MDILQLIGRNRALFDVDINYHEQALTDLGSNSRFLVIGGAGSIGHAVRVKYLCVSQKYCMWLILISNVIEVVRDIRSALGYIDGDFSAFAVDCGSAEFAALMHSSGGYDYVLNLSALKHVRSEKASFTLMRLVGVNIY